MAATSIGTQIELIYKTQFVTFTPDQFSKALKDKNYLEVRGTIPSSKGPMPIQTFSKGDFIVFLAPDEPPPLVFRIINTLSIESKLKEINEMLVALNIYADIVAVASFTCQTRVSVKGKPLDRLTSLVNKNFVSKICQNMGADMKVSSIRFNKAYPLSSNEGCGVTIEPLMTNPEKEYFVGISYLEHDMTKFNKFISEFGADMIQRMIEET